MYCQLEIMMYFNNFWILITDILMECLKALISNALSFTLFRILSAFFISTFQNCSFLSSFKLNYFK